MENNIIYFRQHGKSTFQFYYAAHVLVELYGIELAILSIRENQLKSSITDYKQYYLETILGILNRMYHGK